MTGDEVRDEVPLTTFDQPPFGGVGAGWRHLVDYLDAVRDRILPQLRDRAQVRPAVDLDGLDVGRVLEAGGVLRLAQRPPYATVVRRPARSSTSRPWFGLHECNWRGRLRQWTVILMRWKERKTCSFHPSSISFPTGDWSTEVAAKDLNPGVEGVEVSVVTCSGEVHTRGRGSTADQLILLLCGEHAVLSEYGESRNRQMLPFRPARFMHSLDCSLHDVRVKSGA